MIVEMFIGLSVVFVGVLIALVPTTMYLVKLRNTNLVLQRELYNRTADRDTLLKTNVELEGLKSAYVTKLEKINVEVNKTTKLSKADRVRIMGV